MNPPPLLLLNGELAGRGEVTFPRIGRGRAEIRLASDAKFSVGDEITFEWWFPVAEISKVTKMTVAKAGEHRGLGHHIFVQGKNNFHKEIGSRFYEDIPVKNIIIDLLNELPEPFKKIKVEDVYEKYVRRKDEGYGALRALMADRKEIWRWDAPSNLFICQPEVFVPEGDPLWFSDVPRQHRLICEFLPLFFTETAPKIMGQNVDRIVHIVGTKPRTEIFFQGSRG